MIMSVRINILEYFEYKLGDSDPHIKKLISPKILQRSIILTSNRQNQVLMNYNRYIVKVKSNCDELYLS